MVREAIVLLPDSIGRCPAGTAAALAALGLVLWIAGGRISRSALALAAVAAGAILGLHLPEWRGWQVDGMGLAVGGAILLGCAALMMHRTCIGLLLGAVMTLWAGMGTWILLGGGADRDWRSVPWNGDMVEYLRELVRTLPVDLAHVLPAACFAALATGILIVVWFPKLGKVLAHSLIGVTLMALMGGIAVAAARPEWFGRIPGSNAVQGAALIGLVLLGAIVQWQITPPHRRPAGNVPRTS